MAVNNLTYEDSHAFLMDLYDQATGGSSINTVNTADFTTVAQAVLKTGYDNIISSISQVLGRTIFSVRPYSARFKGLEADAQRWGAITRKINFVDGAIETDQRMSLTNGQSVDPWVVNKPEALELNFYGSTEYMRNVTIFRDQLDAAFQSEAQFNSFISGVMQNVADQLEQIKEAESRGVLINLITGRVAQESVNTETGLVINVLQAYRDETGTVLTPSTMYATANWPDFSRWFFGFLSTLQAKLANRTQMFHTNVTGKEVMRHTPADMLKMYIYKPVLAKIDAEVKSTTFRPEYLKAIDWEGIDFWQTMDAGSEDAVTATPVYLKNDGTLDTAGSAIGVDHVIGVVFDRDACGITTESTWMERSPFNQIGGYWNVTYHLRQRTWLDYSEQSIILIADTTTP